MTTLEPSHTYQNTYDPGFLSEDEEEYCPLCIEPLDITDKNFFPCPCGYQICQFCYNNIRQNPELNGRCPACRRKYDDENVRYVVLSPEELKMERATQARKERERKQREKERKENEYSNRKHLAGMRVIQKNLVYVVGINPPVPYEEVANTLKSDKYFGQYGKINKIVVNRKTPHNNDNYHHHSPGYGVYITFSTKEDAAKCIAQVDGTYMDGRMIKAAYGTTKYCSSYLRGLPCPNPNCMFLHEPGEEADSFNKRELHNKQQQQQQQQHVLPNGTNTIFKPLSSNSISPVNNSNTNTTSAMTASNNSSNNISSASPAPIKTQLYHESTTGNATPVLTPAPAPTGSNPWGITQSATPIASLNLSKNNSTHHLPTLSDALSHIPSTQAVVPSVQTENTSHNSSNKKKNSDKDKDYVDPYDSLSNAVRFLDDRIQSLSNYKNVPLSLKSSILDDATYKKYPSLFSWDNIEPSNKSNNVLTKKLIEVLAIKPIDYSASVIQFLQSVNANAINIPSGAIDPNMVNGAATGRTPVAQNVTPLQPQAMNAPPPGMFPVQHDINMQIQAQSQAQQAQAPQQFSQHGTPVPEIGSTNSTDLLNQLIKGRKVVASN